MKKFIRAEYFLVDIVPPSWEYAVQGGCMSITVPGRIRDGKFRPFNPAGLNAWMRDHEGEICKLGLYRLGERKRSLPQNAWYWTAIVKPIADYTGYTEQEMHAVLKEKFLARRHIVIADEDISISPTTTTLTTEEFTNYAERVIAWAASDLGLVLEDPR
jgi:hypothetical protein